MQDNQNQSKNNQNYQNYNQTNQNNQRNQSNTQNNNQTNAKNQKQKSAQQGKGSEEDPDKTSGGRCWAWMAANNGLPPFLLEIWRKLLQSIEFKKGFIMPNIEERYLRAKRALFDTYYHKLNARQREAVYHVNDPLLILAGAGSGKTTVLVNRIAHIIRFGNAYLSEYVPFDLDEAVYRDIIEQRGRLDCHTIDKLARDGQ